MLTWWRAGRIGLALTLAVGLSGGLVSGGSAVAAPASSGLGGPAYGPALGTAVTLITGDRVLIGPGAGPAGVTVRPGAGREEVGFARYTELGDTFVVPADATTLVSSGVLDHRLFNVTDLVEFGYDDRSRGELPLIVDHGAGAPRVVAAGASVTRELPSVDAVAVRQDKRSAGEFWQRLGAANQHKIDGVERILLDGPVRATLTESVPQIGAPAAWQAGHTGAGVTVAVLDTGVDAEHPDLAAAVTEAQDFTESPSGTDDRHGHGTHVASTITGDGSASDGRYVGVAPDANLVIGKVLDDDGFGTEAGIIAGMEWAVGRARVVNLSLGTLTASDGTDLMSQAVNRLTAQTGTLFVIAAGNDGPREESIGSPGAADAALTVGAVDKQNNLAEFSSRGPRLANGAIKPDITAPGVDIVAAKARNGSMGEPVGDQYTRASGTSMATPHVAGAAAILAGQRPSWRATELKAALMGSATPSDGPSVYEQGAGRVDLARATTQSVYATPASVSNGLVQWPHEDDTPISEPVTYHNEGTEPLTLNLAIDVRDPAGNPAPAGMFALNAQQLTVPAGGTASVTVTTDTRVDAPDGAYGGALVATGDGTTIRTPVGVVREVESFDVRVSVLDGQGMPTPDYALRFFGLDPWRAYEPYDPSGTVTIRLPRGRFYLDVRVVFPGQDPERENLAFFVEPELHLDGPRTLVFDSRQARPVDVSSQARPEAAQFMGMLSFLRQVPVGVTGLVWSVRSFEGTYVHPSLTSASAPGQFTFTATAELARPDGAGGYADSPYGYHLGWSVDGRVPAELTRTFADRELAAVPTSYASSTDQPGWIMSSTVELALPARVTHYYAPGLPWGGTLAIGGPEYDDANWANQYAVERAYGRHDRTPQRWGMAVFGPAFPVHWLPGGSWVKRQGDEFDAGIPTFTDQAADHYGYSLVDSAATELYRDGVKLAESADDGSLQAVLPADPGTYRLHTEAVRSSYSELSTRVTADWTFRSEHTAEPRPLPVMAVRFAPLLDDHNRAPAGRPFVVPVYVQRQQDASFGSLTELTVQASFDDGATWRPVSLLGHGLERVALVDHPRGAGFVSLKATAADSDGNRVEQTMIRAYKLR